MRCSSSSSSKPSCRRKRLSLPGRMLRALRKRMCWAVSMRTRPAWRLENRRRRAIPSTISAPISSWPWKRMRSDSLKVGGLPTSWSRTPQARVGGGSSRSSTCFSMSSTCSQTSPSGWCSGGCSTPLKAATSGRTRSSSPEASSSSKPRAAAPSTRIRVSSSRTRSAASASTMWAHSRTACQVPASIWNPRLAARRTARRVRSPSSAKRSAGSPMARTRPASRSFTPPTWSITPPPPGS